MPRPCGLAVVLQHPDQPASRAPAIPRAMLVYLGGSIRELWQTAERNRERRPVDAAPRHPQHHRPRILERRFFAHALRVSFAEKL